MRHHAARSLLIAPAWLLALEDKPDESVALLKRLGKLTADDESKVRADCRSCPDRSQAEEHALLARIKLRDLMRRCTKDPVLGLLRDSGPSRAKFTRTDMASAEHTDDQHDGDQVDLVPPAQRCHRRVCRARDDPAQRSGAQLVDGHVASHPCALPLARVVAHDAGRARQRWSLGRSDHGRPSRCVLTAQLSS